MKKRILFIIGIIDNGGVARSIINLLNVIDTDKYDIHLLIMSAKQSEYEKLIPKSITIHRNFIIGCLLDKWSGIINLFKHRQSAIALGSILRILISPFNKGIAGLLLSKLFPKIEGEYDMIVDYNGQQNLYYMIDKLNTQHKVTFFHSDYKKWQHYKNIDKKYYPKADYIFTISDTCVSSLKNFFPDATSKIKLFENVSRPEIIYKLSEKKIYDNLNSEIILVTIGHVCFNKGTDIALKSAKILKDKGYKFKWLFLGTIIEKEYINLAKKLGLEEYTKFMGNVENPYPYIRKATIVVHTSRFEGKSIAIDESKILCKPIVATNFSTVEDQLTHGVNASICNINPDDVSNSIEKLINDTQLRNKYITYLKNNLIDNSKEINKLYQILETTK